MTISELMNELQAIIDTYGAGVVTNDVVAVDGYGAKWTVQGAHNSYGTPGETVLIVAVTS